MGLRLYKQHNKDLQPPLTDRQQLQSSPAAEKETENKNKNLKPRRESLL